MFKIEASKLPGCFRFSPTIHNDNRGRFVKIFHEPSYVAQGLETDFVEEYYSVSHKNVIRGLHFQVPPFEEAKTLSCVSGAIYDMSSICAPRRRLS